MEEEVGIELQAVLGTYGDDCRLIAPEFPPHLSVHIRPRTADDSSLQFVEIILGIKASAEYPEIPPHVYIIESKGLDQDRQTQVISRVQDRASELSSYPMLLALCEEAFEALSDMNHPEGDCPLCLYPLVTQDKNGLSLPFMKLMSCYHCFHSECIIGWWKWVQGQKDSSSAEETTITKIQNQRGKHVAENLHVANCPVCRTLFDEKDFEHVQDYLGLGSFHSNAAVMDANEEYLILHSSLETERKRNYEALLKLQQEKNGLIEPKRDLAIVPGMFLPQSAMPPTTSEETSTSEGTSTDPCESNTEFLAAEMVSNETAEEPTTSKRNTNVNTRKKNKSHNSRKQFYSQPARRQWLKKGPDTTYQ